MMMQTKVITIVLIICGALAAAGAVTFFVKVVLPDDKPVSVKPDPVPAPPPAPNDGRGQPRGELHNSPPKGY